MKRSAIQRRSPLKAKSPSTATVPVLRKKKCAHCRETFTPTRPMQRACGWNCAIAVGQADKAKAERKQDKAKKEALKTAKHFKSPAQKVANQYARVRDWDEPCISCGKPADASEALTGGGWDGGHYRSVGSAHSLRFNLWNIHKQCKRCNSSKSGLAGNHVEYRKGLVRRYGEAFVERLESDNGIRKWTKDYLQRFIKVIGKRVRRMEKRRSA